MTKFAALSDDASSSAESYYDKSSAAYYRGSNGSASNTSQYDGSEFSIPNISSVCDDSEALMRALADTSASTTSTSLQKTMSSADVGTTAFQDFLLCFDEAQDKHPNSNNNNNATSYEEFRQLLPNKRVMHARSVDSDQIVMLPQFLWQSEGLCCHAGGASTAVNVQQETNDRRILFEEPSYADDDVEEDHEDDDEDDKEVASSESNQEAFSNGPSRLVLAMEDPRFSVTAAASSPTADGFRPRSASLDQKSRNNGGTVADPRYVPRPSSTSPGLREMSKMFHTSSLPLEDKFSKQRCRRQHDEEQPILVVRPATPNKKHAKKTLAVVTPPKNTLQASRRLPPPSELTKSSSTPPVRPNQRLHRRTRSQDETCLPETTAATTPSASASATAINTARTRSRMVSVSPPMIGVIGGRFGKPPRHRRTPSETSSATGQGSENGEHHHQLGSSSSSGNTNNSVVVGSSGAKKGTKKSNPMKKLFRRGRLPSFRKPKPMVAGGTSNNSSDPLDGAADVANILASLEATHLEQQQTRSNKQNAPTKALLELGQSLSTHPSGETDSDTSSIEDVFGNVEDDIIDDDDFDDCYSESSQESRSMDQFFSTPYSSSSDNPYSKSGKTPTWHQYSSQPSSSPSSFSKRELLRCGSVATAKASNLTYDPIADRAKRAELRTFLTRQNEEQQKRFNAPPVEFDAPDGDNVIRVRDAVCEIEVLPKSDAGLGHTGRAPPTAAEF